MVSGAAGGGGRAGVVLWLSVRLRPEGLHQRRGQGFRDAKSRSTSRRVRSGRGVARVPETDG